MKKILIGVFVVITTNLSFGQVYEFNVDTVQNFKHDTAFSLNESIASNDMKYINAQTTNLTFIIDLTNNYIFWKYNNGELYKREIYKILNSKNELFEIWVKFEDGNVNYLLTENKDLKDTYVLIRRKFEGDEIVGWFDPTIKLKKRP